MLKEKAPEDYEIVITYVGIIRQAERSGMWAYLDPPTYDVSDETAFYSVTWYAGTIVHDSNHSRLYWEYATNNGTPVPDDVWTGRQAERICITRQYEVMKAIGAPSYELDYLWSLITQDTPYEDVDGDGDFDWDDYTNRSW